MHCTSTRPLRLAASIARSEKAIARIARKAGHPVQRMRPWRRYTEEQKRWIKDNAPNLDCAELGKRFKTRFAEDATPKQMRGTAKRLGARTQPRPPKPRTTWTHQEVQWLKANAQAFSAQAAAEELGKLFAKQRSAGAVSGAAKKYGLKLASGSLRTPDTVRKAQQAWISEEVEKHASWEAVTQAFNDEFETRVGTKTLQARATKLGVRPDTVAAPGQSALSAEERAWLEHHAHKAGWNKTIKAFNAHFNSSRSTSWLTRHARRAGIECRDGRGRNRARATYWRPDAETRAWLIAQAPTSTCAQLLGLIKIRYDIEIAASTLRNRLKELDVCAKKPKRATPRSAKALAWLEDNAPEYGCTELAAHYEKEFGVRVTAAALKAACRRLGVRIRTETGGRHHWRGSERTWLRTHAPTMQFEALREAFNERFDASVSKHSLTGAAEESGRTPETGAKRVLLRRARTPMARPTCAGARNKRAVPSVQPTLRCGDTPGQHEGKARKARDEVKTGSKAHAERARARLDRTAGRRMQRQ